MPNLGFTEIMVIMLVVLLVFGAKRLPEIGASMGKGIREFKNSFKETQDAVLRDDSPNRRMVDGTRYDDERVPTGGEPKRLSQ